MSTLRIGLTGGIGSGKSAVMAAFQSLGAEAVDADDMARVVVEPGRPALAEIGEHFGERVLTDEGTLNRPALRQIIFSDPGAKTWLEQLLHPLINEELARRLDEARSPYALLVSPLLFETGQNQMVDRILVVDVPESVQLERATRRDGADPDQIRRIMASQMSREERLRNADDVVDNRDDRMAMETAVARLHRRYTQLADTAR